MPSTVALTQGFQGTPHPPESAALMLPSLGNLFAETLQHRNSRLSTLKDAFILSTQICYFASLPLLFSVFMVSRRTRYVEHMSRRYPWAREFPSQRTDIHASHGFVNRAHTFHQHSSTPSTSEPPYSSLDDQSSCNETEQPSLGNVGVRNENLSRNVGVRNENLSTGYSSGRVFLSHSDKQEDFTERLWVDLTWENIFCFFDKHSLLKDEVFPRRIFDAAEKCKVAVVVLSRDFISSRWSMQELCALVEARESTNRKLRICPLYFETTPEELRQQIASIERDAIPEAWEHIMNSRKERIGRAACLRALKTLRLLHGWIYNQMQGEVAYRRQIVRDIRSLLLENEKHKDPSSDPLETREKKSTWVSCSFPETIPSSSMEESEFGLWAIARSPQMLRRKGGQELTHLEPSSSGDIDEALSSDYLWEQVFLSYSAKQRAVVEQLYIDLTRASISCFFDRRSFSEGQWFNPPHSFEAPETCEVAIVVVSEDYIASELAMLQLCAFVEAEKTVNSKLKIYPLFYQMSPDEFSQRIDYIKEKGFPESWSRFANFSQRSTGFMSLLEALEALRSYEKPLYVQNYGMADYRHKLLCDVHRLLSPNIKGKERLCRVVANLFKQAPCYNDGVKVIGLYGIDGSGKTTLCKSLCGFYFDDFKGKVFHAEFHKQGLPVETLKGLLQTLTDANEESVNLVGNYEQALSLLKQQMSNQRVFLCLDNIPDRLKSVKEAQAYLTAGFGMGSLVLLTAGSMEILERVIPEAKKRSFVPVPNLCEEEAIDVLLNLSEVKVRNLTSEERYAAAYADLCCFGEGMGYKERSYHPLALTVLGAYLCEKGSCKPSQWRLTPGFNEYHNAQELMFRIIEQTINAFDPYSLTILLLLIFSVPNLEFVLNFNHSIFRWIADVCLDESNQSVRDAIYGMKIRGLLEGRGRNSISFHNTVVEFGKSKLKEMKQWLSLEGKDEVPNAVASSIVEVLKLKNYTPSRTFPFNQFRNVSVVHLERVWNLETLNFESMRAVRSITIVECYALREIRGLCGLSSPLRFLKVEGCEALVQCPEIGGLKQLRHLHMQLEADIDKILRVGLETCFCLEEIYLDGICYVSVPRRLRRVRSITINNSHYCVVPLDFTDCLKLQWIKLWNCNRGYPSLNLTRCINVRSIYVRKNDAITEIVGLDELIALEELHLIDMNSIEKLPSFRQLENLSHLTLQNMAKLKELPDLSNCHRLKNVDIDGKLLYMMCPN